ncbi:hypothetical protein BFW38_07835 [Terasakiispira papahanaumokuakeensis]|uniref:Chemotaxis protein n=1 Tax=Terasakiispira papahanaumokuakeensis TaxID=197479 RepID=A0A1E2V8Y2_9GAMM|nr:methyl-accepting chemotaxis protein [Terasakiispira papahanaumokuakeensis]ODC03469.1 hypothetical protein BFW38_07835 [Terasakiispira papahanaumokuakeensis]
MAISLRTRILSVSVAAITLVTGYLVYESTSALTQQMQNSLLHNARNFAGAYGEEVGHWLSSRQRVVSALARHMEKYPNAAPYPAVQQAYASGGFALTYFGNADGQMFRQDPAIDRSRPNYDPRTRGWYKNAISAGGPSVSLPYMSSTLKQLGVIVTDVVYRHGSPYGAIGANLTLDQLSKQVATLDIPGSGLAMIVDKNNDIIAHPDADMVMKKASEIAPSLDNQRLTMLAADNRLLEEQIQGKTDFAYAQAIPDTQWTLVFLMDKAELMAPVYKVLTRQLIIAALMLIGFIGLLYALFKVLFKDLDSVSKALNEIAEGEGDLRTRIEVKRQDEIGLLAQGFNKFVDHMHGVVTRLVQTSKDLAEEAQNMSAASSQRAERVTTQQNEIDMVASAVTEMASATQEIAGNAESTAAAASESVTLGNTGRQQVEQSRDSTRALANEVNKAGEGIAALDDHAQKISTILSTISDIAEQTNLLALNAAIEAARAGDQGRGFAVVADEVRMLSQRTHKATGEIQHMIEALQKRTSETVESMQSSYQRADTSVKDADKATENLTQIAESIRSISEMATQIATAAEEQTSVTQDISSNTENIRVVASELADEINAGVEQAGRLSQLAHDVKNEVSRFKI